MNIALVLVLAVYFASHFTQWEKQSSLLGMSTFTFKNVLTYHFQKHFLPLQKLLIDINWDPVGEINLKLPKKKKKANRPV